MATDTTGPVSSSASLSYAGSAGQEYHQQRFGARSRRAQLLRASVFTDLGRDDLTIVDFGCGTGGVSRHLAARRRLGVEVNETAIVEARAAGIEIVSSLEEVPSDAVDVAISHHALEHVDHPIHVIRMLFRVLKPGGVLRVVVPGESPFSRSQRTWTADSHRHLFSWTPRSLGHLVALAGFADVRTRIVPPVTGSAIARLFTRLPRLRERVTWARARWRCEFNVVVEARKPAASGDI